MLRSFELSSISENRNVLMGLSAVFILVCHASGRGVPMPDALLYLFSVCNVGVDMFFFLSGIGCYYSLYGFYNDGRGESHFHIRKWYCKRFARIIIPYLIIVVPITFPRYLSNGCSIADWLLFVSTLDYWISHHGVWFVAAIMPIYLAAPFVFKLMRRFGAFICLVPVLGFYMTGFADTDVQNSVVYNVLFVTVRIPSFFLGMMLGKYVKDGVSVSTGYIVLSLLMALIILITARRLVYTYIFLLLPIAWAVPLLLRKPVRLFLEFMGNISLESYLTNVIFSTSAVTVPLSCFGVEGSPLIVYMLFVVLGVSCAYLYHIIGNKIMMKNG